MKKPKVYYMALNQEYSGAYCDEDYVAVYEAKEVDLYLKALENLKRYFKGMAEDTGILSSLAEVTHDNRIGEEMLREMKKLLGDKYEKI